MAKEDPYLLTIYLASPGTPLKEGGTSFTGHMYLETSHADIHESFGFAPSGRSRVQGRDSDEVPGEVSGKDVENYRDPEYARTMEITREQYEKIREFSADPAKHGFDMKYDSFSNSCVDFSWAALNHAGLYRQTVLGGIKGYEGEPKVLHNEPEIQKLRAPFPESEFNREVRNPKPERDLWQLILSDNQTQTDTGRLVADGTPTDPLHRQAEEAVSRLEQGLGREYDENSARLAASSASLAKEHGLSRIDHVVLSEHTPSARQGENVFVVEGALNDPAHKMAHMKTGDAIAQPVAQSLAQLQSLGETQQQSQQQEQQQREQSITPQHRMT
ncbi:XVIPCD domain-containing protein [Xanthomonas sp. WHRI 10064A]|uniref:XVIPCD domain-containing protein n=1 Tax=unclassified Xanthomonas TaxID=2643310 RepID=UPI002B22B496|nr:MULTISPECIES: XVIPCD domain-containing protein [unclassified Xanthomonas]MEA9588683.1 XVIPCD domain-containing protein [Xanthomonas sp. WHRI 10064B]MEA9613668.1 XVIPCD domain-containing protein [Xanthomonas sp. WHRI 10064A]